MKKQVLIFLISIFLSVFTGCQYYSYGLDEFLYRDNSIRNRANRLLDLTSTGAPAIPASGIYDILVITDVHFGGEGIGKNGNRRDEEFIDWIQKFYVDSGRPLPAFCICLGDVAEHGLLDEFKNYVELTDKLKNRFGIVTYNVIGNHDLYNAGWNNYVKTCFPGTSFYKFRTPRLTYYFLDSASCSLGDEQLTAFKRDMEYNEKGRKKLVFTHVPAYAEGHFYFVMQNTIERNKFISYCAKNDVISLVDGHTHKEFTSDLGFVEYNLPGYLETRTWTIFSVDEKSGLFFKHCVSLN